MLQYRYYFTSSKRKEIRRSVAFFINKIENLAEIQ